MTDFNQNPDPTFVQTPDIEDHEPQHASDEEVTVHDAELLRLESLERHGQLTNASDRNALAELRGQDVYEPPTTQE